jgi:hypothetical protein
MLFENKYCYECGAIIRYDEAFVIANDDDRTICKDCFHDDYVYCCKCNDVIHHKNIFFDIDNEYWCPECAEQDDNFIDAGTDLVELLMDMEREKPFSDDVLRKWLEMLENDDFTCPCSLLKDKSVECPEQAYRYGVCECKRVRIWESFTRYDRFEFAKKMIDWFGFLTNPGN